MVFRTNGEIPSNDGDTPTEELDSLSGHGRSYQGCYSSCLGDVNIYARFSILSLVEFCGMFRNFKIKVLNNNVKFLISI